MRRSLLIWSLSMLALPACNVTHANSSTLPPLDSTTTSHHAVVTVPPPLQPVPHHAWYVLHREAIDEQLSEMRTLSADLADADDPDWLALICMTGIDLDRPAHVEAYTAPDVHPEWISATDLTRWMIASCSSDARQSVDAVLPLLDAALTRFEAWRSTLTDS